MGKDASGLDWRILVFRFGSSPLYGWGRFSVLGSEDNSCCLWQGLPQTDRKGKG